MRRADIDWASTSMGPMAEWPEPLLFSIDLIDAARQPMVVCWGPDRLMFYNEAYAPFLDGKPCAQGQPIQRVFAEAWDVVGGIFARAEAGESVYIEDLRVPLTRDGVTNDAWWTLSYSRLPTGEGAVQGILCIVQETTRLHLAEEGRRAAQAELTRIADLVPSLLWKADGFGRTTWQNGRLKALAATHGANASNIWRKLMHPDDIDGLLRELNRAKIERRAFAKAVRLCVAPGEYRWHLVRSEPTIDDTGDLVGWYGVATDIQDLREASDAAEEGGLLLREFALNTSALLWIADLRTATIARLTPNFGAVWPGQDPDQPWTLERFMASIHERDRPVIQAGLERAQHGEVVAGKYRVVRPDGLRVLQGAIFPIASPDGRITRVGGMLEDVTCENRLTVSLIDADPASRNKWSHGMRRRGIDVVAFETLDAFSEVAASLAIGPVIVRHHNARVMLERLAGLLNTTSSPRPWLVIQEPDRPAREAVEIMRLGACDIIEADASIETLVDAVTAVRAATPAANAEAGPGRVYRLTSREYEIAQALVAGGTNKTIGQTLGISPRTVESHRSRLMERLNVGTLAELVAIVTSPSFVVDIRP